jgi:hypothetical protein
MNKRKRKEKDELTFSPVVVEGGRPTLKPRLRLNMYSFSLALS